ncbi:serine carboxypeptidase-like 17 [Coffea eugenioides]|uniref:serine carboxypeptidase-like 17 n=1 Tax=Coffea eugenioides TaxID=49369 RepID=UPI000F60AE9C|nr:serine carboxypeptidase-like 17 [Coffea eugenioides]
MDPTASWITRIMDMMRVISMTRLQWEIMSWSGVMGSHYARVVDALTHLVDPLIPLPQFLHDACNLHDTAPMGDHVMERCLILNLLLLFLLLINVADAQIIVKSLPGYPGALPFKLETGYVGVGENDSVQLFYYFIESERDVSMDPLVLWLTGGPGCSAFSGLVYEIGPLSFDDERYNGSLPSLHANPYAWTKIASIILLDLPVGTGFSYATTSQGYFSSDTKSTKDAYLFLQKWLLNHPRFMKNRLYIAGDSYAGKIVPMVVLEISNGNEAGLKPRMSVEGYMVGNPITDSRKDENWKVPYADRLGLISDEYYERAKSSCNGEYINPSPNNTECLFALHLIQEDDTYVLSRVWMNDPTVQEALQIREGTKEQWRRCNGSISYDMDVASVFDYHQVLIRKGYQALIYSGDHDMVVPYLGTLQWIRDLNLTVEDDWRPWFVNGQIAGYTLNYQFKEDVCCFTFATVKGAGHTAPEYKPKECFAMIDRWFTNYPL